MNLQSWLQYIQRVHPSEIELGLDRVATVAKTLGIAKPRAKVITVAGTNGKGSCIAALESILQGSGVTTGSYTSPHVHVFNERVKLRGRNASDAQLCQAFAAIDKARQQISLSYFEFATLAALWLFQQSNVDVWLLEVGLGGRLDAVNIIDADIAIITSIDLDHMDWLGDTRELIAVEKAGIIRSGRPVICGDLNPPQSLLEHCSDSPLYRLTDKFSYQLNEANERSWHWRGLDRQGQPLQIDNISLPGLDLANIACALQALALLEGFELRQHLASAANDCGKLQLAGRFEQISYQVSPLASPGRRNIVLDVAHNRAACELLAQKLQHYRRLNPGIKRIYAIVAMMADKDINAVCHALESVIDSWHVAQFDDPRCLSAARLAEVIAGLSSDPTQRGATVQQMLETAPTDMAKWPQQAAQDNTDSSNSKYSHISQYNSVGEAFDGVYGLSNSEDLIVITGSFITVAEVRTRLLGSIETIGG